MRTCHRAASSRALARYALERWLAQGGPGRLPARSCDVSWYPYTRARSRFPQVAGRLVAVVANDATVKGAQARRNPQLCTQPRAAFAPCPLSPTARTIACPPCCCLTILFPLLLHTFHRFAKRAASRACSPSSLCPHARARAPFPSFPTPFRPLPCALPLPRRHLLPHHHQEAPPAAGRAGRTQGLRPRPPIPRPWGTDVQLR